MLWKHAALGDEKGFGTFKCVEATSITTGYFVALRVGTNASFDGTQVVMARSGTAIDLPGFVGIAAQDIGSNLYGRVQVYGAVASVAFSNVGTSITINVGDPLVPGAMPGGGASLAPTYASSGFRFVIASAVPAAISAVGWMSGWVRAI
ncbi:MAG TPA: hypothetical protein VF974_08230 [Patescibacteria group bacterium]